MSQNGIYKENQEMLAKFICFSGTIRGSEARILSLIGNLAPF